MQEAGRVVRIVRGRAEVDVEARDACEHCSAHSICNWTGNKLRRVLAVNEAGAVVGDHVLLGVEESAGARTNLVVFGIPVVLMLAGVLVGGLLLSDKWAAVLSGVGLALGLGIVKIVDVAVARSGRSLPVVLRRISKAEAEGASCEAGNGSGDSPGDGDGRKRAGADAAD